MVLGFPILMLEKISSSKKKKSYIPNFTEFYLWICINYSVLKQMQLYEYTYLGLLKIKREYKIRINKNKYMQMILFVI